MAELESHLGEIANGFTVTRQLLREALQFDREGHALQAVLSSRLDGLDKQVTHLLHLVEQGNGRDPLVAQVHTVRQELDALWRAQQSRESLTTEGIKGRWTVIGMAITAGSGVILGLINLLK